MPSNCGCRIFLIVSVQMSRASVYPSRLVWSNKTCFCSRDLHLQPKISLNQQLWFCVVPLRPPEHPPRRWMSEDEAGYSSEL